MKSLKGSQDPQNDLLKLLSKYPEVTRVIPILVAVREGVLTLLDSLDPAISYLQLDFSKQRYSQDELKHIVKFTNRTGLLEQICRMESTADYLLGVEVGLDTNARKNRSGLFLEQVVREAIQPILKRNKNLSVIEQIPFNRLANDFGIPVPESSKGVKFDFVILGGDKPVNIEVNFYGGTGSKPNEISRLYSKRGPDLSDAGWKFVWLTDGQGWEKMKNLLGGAVRSIDYVINTELLRKGLLESIVLDSKQ